VQDGNISKGSEQSGNKMLNQIRMGMQKQYFDMMENKLNPYRRKKSNQTIISCKKTETGGSSIYWRRYSGSVEQSVKDNRSF